jgi:hypothetical protein
MTRFSDTSPEAERVWREVLRRLSFHRRWADIGQMYDAARGLHAAGYRMRHPEATNADVERDWRAQAGFAGPDLRAEASRPAIPRHNLQVAERVMAALMGADVGYALTGGWAINLYGKQGHSRDIDLIVKPFPSWERVLTAALSEDFQVRQGRPALVLGHADSGILVNLVESDDSSFGRSVLKRRRSFISSESNVRVVSVAPEDVILLSLGGYRRSGAVNETTLWADLRGVLEVQAGRLDDAYLDRWAADLGVSDLLRRAREEAAV